MVINNGGKCAFCAEKISTKCAFFRYNELNKRNNSNHKLGMNSMGEFFV